MIINRLRQFFFSAVVVFALSGCDAGRPGNPPQPLDPSGCEPACGNLQDMGCETGEDIQDGACTGTSTPCRKPGQCYNGICFITCRAMCVDLEQQGRPLDTQCIRTANTCSYAETQCTAAVR